MHMLSISNTEYKAYSSYPKPFQHYRYILLGHVNYMFSLLITMWIMKVFCNLRHWLPNNWQPWFRRGNQLLGIVGWEKWTLLRHAPFGIYFEVLIGCGSFIFCACRYFSFDIFYSSGCKSLLVSLFVMLFCLLKAMIIIAWNGSGTFSSIFEADVFKKVLSVFVTAAILKLAQGIQDGWSIHPISLHPLVFETYNRLCEEKYWFSFCKIVWNINLKNCTSIYRIKPFPCAGPWLTFQSKREGLVFGIWI